MEVREHPFLFSAEMRKNSEVGNKIIDEMRKITEIIMEDIDRIILLINISKLEVIAITKFLHSILEEDETREDNDIEELEQNIIDLVRSLKISSEKHILTLKRWDIIY